MACAPKSRNHWKRSLLTLFLLNATVLAFPQGASDPSRESPSGDEAYVLSLEQATRLALQNNFEIQLAKYDAWIARTQEGVATSIYDTVIEAEIQYRNDQSKPTSSLMGSKTVTNDYNLSLSKKLPTGTTLTIDSTNNRTWSDSGLMTINPSHESSAGLTIEQELGRNFFGMQDRGNIKITRLDIANSELLSLDKIEADIAQVQKAYWDLVLQHEAVRIAKDMVDLAKQLFDINLEKVDKGLVEEPDVLAAEANYQQAVNDLLLAESQLETKANVLKLLLNIKDDSVVLSPRDGFVLPDQEEQYECSLQAAFDNRYDYREAKNQIEARDIKLALNKNKMWPEINLKASLAKNGVDDHFSRTFEQIAEEDNPDFFAGLSVSFPLENSKARAELKAAQLDKARMLVALKFLERQITIGIIDQVRLCNVLKAVAVNERNIAGVQERKLRAEERRFSFGRSDTDTLIRFQQDLAAAKLAAAEAQYRYYAALIDLRKSEGVLLSAHWDGAI